MPYQSSSKRRIGGRVADPLVEAASLASMAATGPDSPGDGSAAWSLSPAFDTKKEDRLLHDES